MERIVQINEDNCVTCHLCEVACIVAHSRYGDPVKAYRLENPRPLPMSLLVHRGPISLPVICRHCEHPFCVDACLSGALSKETDGAVRVNVQKCIGCASCVMACPFGAIRLRKDLPEPKALKCNLCPERDLPACVQACPNRALTFEMRSTVDNEAHRRALEVVGQPAPPYVIIGGGIAAAAAVRGIRAVDPDGDIYLIAPEVIGCYSKALLSHYLVNGEHRKLLYRESDYFAQYGVQWVQGRRAIAIDVERNRVQLDDGSQLTYGSLLICTGGRPFVPPMEGSNKAGVFTFTELDDVERLREYISDVESAVVIGGGFIGLEVADALHRLDKQVTVVEIAPRILVRALDARGSQVVQQIMEAQGVVFKTNDTVEAILGDERVEGVQLRSGERLSVQMVVIAIGVRPNADVVYGTPIDVNRGIVVDSHMRTSIPNIYAAGDVVETIDITDGERRVLALLPLASEQGEIAGWNMAGGNREYRGGLPMNTLKFLPINVISGGLAYSDREDLTVLVNDDAHNGIYRKVMLDGDRLVGFVVMGEDVTGAGIYTGLIRAGISVAEFKDALVRTDFCLADLPRWYREQRFMQDCSRVWSEELMEPTRVTL